MFNYIKQFKRPSATIGPIKNPEGKIIYNENEKRETFANFFEGLQTTPKPEHIISDWDELFKVSDTDKPTLSNESISYEEVRNIIKDFKSTSSPGADKISPEIIQGMLEVVAPILCQVFNKAIEEQLALYEYYEVILYILFKGGDKTSIMKFRPISLFNIFARTFDKAIYQKTERFLEENKLINNHQWGGRKKRSPLGLVNCLIM